MIGFSHDVFDDEDVLAERQRVETTGGLTDPEQSQIMIAGLTKYFSNHKAVDSMYLGIPRGECFGLLGKYQLTNRLWR